MKNNIMIFTIIATFCIFIGVAGANTVANGNIWLDNIETTAGSTVTYQVRLENNAESVSSLRIPLVFDKTNLTCVNVEFTATIASGGMSTRYKETDSGLEIVYTPSMISPISSFTDQSGLLATIVFQIESSAQPGELTVETASYSETYEQYGNSITKWTRAEMGSVDGIATYIPTVDAGSIMVKQPTDINDRNSSLIPTHFGLNQNYPNPFNPATTISFALPEKASVRLEIFNLLGQSVALLADGEFMAGYHNIEWNAADVPSGVYFYKIRANSVTLTQKMMLLK